MIIAYVPARGGSKEILRKNLVDLGEKKLLERTMEAASTSRLIDQIWVSTDDSEIAARALELGGEVGYERPEHLAQDDSSIADGLIHFLDWLQSDRDLIPDLIVVLQPTSPMRDGILIDDVVEEFKTSGVPSLFTVSEVLQHPQEMIRIFGDSSWSSVLPTMDPRTQRQGYDKGIFYINGSMYLVTPDFIRETRVFVVPGRSTPIVIPREFGLEIDTSFDLLLARRLVNDTR